MGFPSFHGDLLQTYDSFSSHLHFSSFIRSLSPFSTPPKSNQFQPSNWSTTTQETVHASLKTVGPSLLRPSLYIHCSLSSSSTRRTLGLGEFPLPHTKCIRPNGGGAYAVPIQRMLSQSQSKRKALVNLEIPLGQKAPARLFL